MKKQSKNLVKTIEENSVFKNDFLELFNNLVEFPDGSLHNFVALKAKDFVNILPFTTDNKILMVKQYRYPWNIETYELPAGMIDDEKNETPIDAVHRELAEETGYKVIELEKIRTYRPLGVTDMFGHLFSAKVKLDGKPNLEKTELLTIVKFSEQEVKDLLKENKIVQAASLLNLYQYFLSKCESDFNDSKVSK